MDYIIGVDGGGSKTEAAAYRVTDGKFLNRVKTGFSNPVNDKETALNNLNDAIEVITSKLKDGHLCGIYLGIAGCEVGDNAQSIRESIQRKFNIVPVVMNDAELALKAMLKGKDGILVICGTGSAAFGINKGRSERCGGWGYLLGDEGSGYSIAIRAIKRMIYEQEHGIRESDLTRKILQELGLASVNDITDFVYSSTKNRIASLSKTVSKLAENGDEVSRNILIKEGEAIARTTELLYKKLQFESVSIALVGGVIRKSIIVRNSFEDYLRKNINIDDIIDDDISPTEGALYVSITNKDICES